MIGHNTGRQKQKTARYGNTAERKRLQQKAEKKDSKRYGRVADRTHQPEYTPHHPFFHIFLKDAAKTGTREDDGPSNQRKYHKKRRKDANAWQMNDSSQLACAR